MSKCTGAPWIDTQKGVTGKTKLPFLPPWIWLEKRPTGQWCLEGPNFWKAVSYRQLQTCIGLLDTSAFFSFTSQLRRICIAALFNQKSAWLNWRTSLKYRDKRKNHQLKVNNLVNGVSCFLPDELVFQLVTRLFLSLIPLVGSSICVWDKVHNKTSYLTTSRVKSIFQHHLFYIGQAT